MEALSLLVLILLSLYGYSSGSAALRKSPVEPKPRPADLLIMLLLWSAGVGARSALPWNPWLLTLGWAVLAHLAGRLSRLVAPEKPPGGRGVRKADEAEEPAVGLKKLRHRWTAFSRRAGSFQTRLILSFFFLLVAAPFALAVKIRDPLRLREKNRETFWIDKKGAADDLERSRRQF